MKKQKLGCFIALLLLIPFSLWAQEAFVKDGNVYIRDSQSKVIQLTTSQLDSSPQLSPDGKLLAFVRDTPGLLVSAGAGEDISATELWIVNIGTKHAELLVKGKENNDVKKTLAAFTDPQFSPDCSSIYFKSAAWVTSDSIQKISLDTKKVQFITDGNKFDVILKGKYKDFLLVDRGIIKYDKKGNSLGRDTYLYLVSPDAKTIKEIGQSDSKAALNFRNKYFQAAAGTLRKTNEITYTENNKKQLTIDNIFYYKKLLGDYVDNDSYNNIIKYIKISNVEGKSADFEYYSTYNNVQVCGISISNASVTQDRHFFDILYNGTECQVLLRVITPPINELVPNQFQTNVEIKYRGNCDKYCYFDNINLNEVEADDIETFKKRFYPSGDKFKDIKHDEYLANKRKIEEAERWK